ncbi:hypothetical protein PQQ65_28960 [Paraburkholderia strydomiana]|uniref:hypothetical protein n=1 Tax=Paraburkholderia strydomiana TaxID=1245417 RepID=UPI0038BCD466
MLWQTDDFGELTPPDQDTLSSSEDQIPGGRHGGIFEVQAIRAKLPLANAVHQLNARYGGGRVPLRVLRQQALGLHLRPYEKMLWLCLGRALREYLHHNPSGDGIKSRVRGPAFLSSFCQNVSKSCFIATCLKY